MTRAQSPTAGTEPLSVSAAVGLARDQVKQWPSLVVVGEVSGFRGPNARSGHCYFEVKDESSSMSVIVWRGVASSLSFRLKDGLSIQLTGRFDVYAASGKLSFVATKVEAVGEGLLRQQVAELARKLDREGLMAADRKRAVPAFCTRVCVVTSLSGSVIDDVKRTLARRNPLVQIDVVGASVQGADAPATIIRALSVAASTHPDAILLVRGGGSFEDLMCFNDEQLARAIAACSVPVVTGIGHEPDTSIADMVADRRCSTPTAAAESVAPAVSDLESILTQRQARLGRAMSATLIGARQQVDALARSSTAAIGSSLARRRESLLALGRHRCLMDPRTPILERSSAIELTAERLHAAIPRALEHKGEGLISTASRLDGAGRRLLRTPTSEMARLAASLEALSPLSVLARGYAFVQDPSGHVIKSARAVAPGDEVSVTLAEGALVATVTSSSETHAKGQMSPEGKV